MPNDLFRKEALESFSAHRLGESRYHAGNLFLLLATALVLLLSVSGWVLGNSSYTRKHLVTGKVDSTGSDAIVSPDWGYVREILVSEGQQVTAGQPVLAVSRRLDDVDAEQSGELEQQITHWGQIAEEKQSTFEARHAAVVREERQHAMQEQLIRSDIQLQKIKVRERSKHLQESRALHASGHLSNIEWINFRTSLISEQQRLGGLKARLLEIQYARTTQREALLELESEHRLQLAEIEIRISGARSTLIETRQEPTRMMAAGSDAVVSRIETTKGASVTPGQKLVYLLRDTKVTSGTLFIPPHAAGHLEEGQHMQLDLDAFPARNWGWIPANVEQLSKHSIAGENSELFVARVIIKPPATVTLLPGMTFTAPVEVEKNTLFGWLLKPVASIAETFE